LTDNLEVRPTLIKLIAFFLARFLYGCHEALVCKWGEGGIFSLIKNDGNCNSSMSSKNWWVQKIIRRRRRRKMEANNFTKGMGDLDEEVEFPLIIDRAVELAFPARTFGRPRFVLVF